MAPISPQHRPGCARLGIARLNAFRLNVAEPIIGAYINGALAALRIEGASISQILNEQVDTANFRTKFGTPAPVAGQRIEVYQAEKGFKGQIFGGHIIETTGLYEKKPDNVAYDLRCIDPTWLLNRQKVLAYYLNKSATAIVLDIVATKTRGVTTRNVAPGLPVIDAITFTNENVADCLTAVCRRIGAYWYLDYQNDLHVFFNEANVANAISDGQPHGSADHQITEDLSQVATRIIARGGGVGASVEIQPGATELPVEEGTDKNWYAATGGQVEVGPQVLTYAGVRGRGGAGAFVGTGNAPSGAPIPAPAGGSTHTFGATYQYAVSFTTATGETLPGPLASILIQNIVMNPPLAPSARTRGPGSYPPGALSPGGSSFRFMFQVGYVGGAMGPGGAISPVYTWDGNDWEIYIGPQSYVAGGVWYPAIESSFVAPVNWIMVHRSDNGGPWMGAINYLPSSYFGSAAGWYGGNCQGYSSGGGPYPLPPSGFGGVLVRGIPTSNQTAVTGRKVYRTVANGSALKLAITIANNTLTETTDPTTDAGLGAAPPAADTSGIKDEGQVTPGSTSFPVSSTTPFAADVGPSGGGGWVRVGNLPVRYTGIGSGTLTGVPATGVGSISAAVRYGTQVLVQPRLFGIPPSGAGAIIYPIKRGDTVTIRLWTQDDLACEVMGYRLGGTGHDGIIEEIISDSRFDLIELADHMAATLAERKDPHVTVTFTSRDPSLEVGHTVAINISKPPISGTFRIQRVTFSEIAITGGLARTAPLRRIEATNKLYTFADLLRQLRGRESGVP